MSTQVNTYPILFDPQIAFLNNLKYIDFGLDQTLPTIDEIQKASGTTNKESELIESGILDDLNHAVNVSEEDYYKVTYPSFTEDITINNMIQDDRENYFSERIYAQATQICDYIDGLIQLDRYPKDMFGKYKMLRNFIHSTDDQKERSRALNQLRIIARSIIPVKVKQERVEVIEPSLLSPSSVSEGN